MEYIIKTDRSFLATYTINKDISDLITNHISTIDTQLLKNPKIRVFNKECTQHRSIGFYSDSSIGYIYSGQIAKSKPLDDELKKILVYINEMFNAKFNGILINKYESGLDYISEHSDDEKNLDPIGVITLSIGAIRKFRVRNKITKKYIDIPTDPNKIIHMGGDFQKEFTHGIPIQKKIKESRYSLTLRKHLT